MDCSPILNEDSTSIDDNSFSIDDIDYVEASPPDSELVSLEEVKDFHTEDGEIKDYILHEKLSKINLTLIEAKTINPDPPSILLIFDQVISTSITFLGKTTPLLKSYTHSKRSALILEEK
ncbi:hypothetical protein Tco_0647086 [Tanacetum coccineum]